MPKPSAREFFSSSQKFADSQKELEQQIQQLEAERTQLLQQLEQTVGNQAVSKGVEVPISEIKRRPYQSRREKDPVAHAELVEAIQTYGFRGTIWVQKLPDGALRLIAGESRLNAASEAGLERIPVDIVQTDDMTAVKLSRIENARRRNLNAYDDTKEILYLLTLMLNLEEAEVVKLLYQMKNASEGKTSPIDPEKEKVIQSVFADVAPEMSWQSFVSSRLRLLNLPEDVLKIYNTGKLAYTKALVIAGVNDEEIRHQLLKATIQQDWSLETLKAQIKTLNSNQLQSINPTVQRLEKSIGQIESLTAKKLEKMSSDDRQSLFQSLLRMERILQEKKELFNK